MEDEEIIREFLIESNENLNRLDTEVVDLERNPTVERLASIFRTIHTIKGTCGFLGFGTLESVTHHAETILSQLRSGQRPVNGPAVSLILETVDTVRQILNRIEKTGGEGQENYSNLVGRLERSAALNKDALPRLPSSEAEKQLSAAETTIRVDVSLLDKLMNLVGELVLARNQIRQFTTEKNDAALTAASQRLSLITTELQEGVMKTRMQPIGVVWNKLPRMVRDVSQSLGKQIELRMEGADIELDRSIIEAIKDPFLHLIRNSCDHGLETAEQRLTAGKAATGLLKLKAYHDGGHVTIEISDDGKGVDAEQIKKKALEKGLIRPEEAPHLTERDAINLLFVPGFSTASQITHLSGRGVGMDVVKANVEKIGGAVDISTAPGRGTTVKLKIPLTLAIIPGLLITSGGQRFVIPQVSLLELIRLEGASAGKIEYIHKAPVYRRRGSILPLAHLNEVLGLRSSAAEGARNIVVLQAEGQRFGLTVDGISDTQEIVVKPLGRQLKGLTCYSGAAIMGDGEVALILDVAGIGQLANVLSKANFLTNVPAEQGGEKRGAVQQGVAAALDSSRFFLFSAGSFKRLAVPLSSVERLEEFPLSSIEWAGGRQVVQYRGRILPLLSASQLLEPEAGGAQAANDPIQVVVLADEGRSAGLIIDRILDVANEPVSMPRGAQRHALSGAAVVGKHIADFLDVEAVLQAAGGFDETLQSIERLAHSLTARERTEARPVRSA